MKNDGAKREGEEQALLLSKLPASLCGPVFL